jgi:hypothetical protein
MQLGGFFCAPAVGRRYSSAPVATAATSTASKIALGALDARRSVKRADATNQGVRVAANMLSALVLTARGKIK